MATVLYVYTISNNFLANGHFWYNKLIALVKYVQLI